MRQNLETTTTVVIHFFHVTEYLPTDRPNERMSDHHSKRGKGRTIVVVFFLTIVWVGALHVEVVVNIAVADPVGAAGARA